MSICIMQPYIFPYIGYFQLIYASEVFVFYDDVNFINRGWINRNRILLNGKDHMITVPCREASQNKLILDVAVADDAKGIQKLLTTVKAAYSKAPHFEAVYPIIENILLGSGNIPVAVGDAHGTTSDSIANMAIKSVELICDYLGLKRVFKKSSEHYNNRELKKADRLIDICVLEDQTHYINASGGKAIYTKEYYSLKGISLDFLNPQRYEYAQFGNTFVPWLSMIDVLMFNDKEVIVSEILPLYYLD